MRKESGWTRLMLSAGNFASLKRHLQRYTNFVPTVI